MQVLITGGAGFIGSHLADALLREHHQVSVLDDLSTGSLENIAHLRANSSFTFCRGSVFDADLLDPLLAACDIVFHLAAAVGVKRIIQNPVETIQTNVAGTELLLRLAARQQRRVVIASTSEVYGKSTQLPFREDGQLVLGATTQARWGYACSKAIDELMALAYFREHALPVTIVRLFNTVGPRQSGRYGMVLPTFVTQALCGDPITVFGTGEQTRCFTHVGDIAAALLAVMNCGASIGEIYNLGTTDEISINQLADAVIKATQSKSRIVHIPYDRAYTPGFEDMQRRLPDISKARAAFGFHSRRSLSEILSDIIADQANRLNLKERSSSEPQATKTKAPHLPASAAL
jgi:UDP-glucose 4-epimerase